LRATFVKEVSPSADDHVVRHLAQCFGHIYAAGVLAIRAGTIPWSEDLVRMCVRRCFLDARRELKTDADLLGDALSILKARIESSTVPLAVARKMSPSAMSRCSGFRETSWGRMTVTVRAEAFKFWFDDPRQPRLLLEWLASQGALSNRPTADKAGLSIVWAETQPQWPHGKRLRSISLDLRGDILTRQKDRAA
jgi:hypothetical protein